MKFLMMMLALGAVGCTTTSFSVHTNPSGADVYARAVGSSEYRHLGITPLYLTNVQMERAQAANGAVQLEVRMEGYKPDDFIVTEISKVNLHINRELQPKRDLEMQTWLDKHINEMLNVRELVATHRYKEALQILQRLKEQTPMVATIHRMEGGVQLLLRDYAAALRAYRTAAKLDPESTESIRMVRHLEKTFGFRREVDVFDTNYLKDQRLPAQHQPTEGEKGEQ